MPLVFLSYASEDDIKLQVAESSRWVAVFHEALESKLKKRLRTAEVWYAPRNYDQTGAIKVALSDEIKNSDFLLPVWSVPYNTKQYTQLELDEFIKLVDSKARDLHRGASDAIDFIIPVLPEPLPDDEFVQPLAGAKYVPFFKTVDNRDVPFFEGIGSPAPGDYYAAIREIVALIEERFKKHEKPRATVYVAQTSNDRLSDYRSVINELKSQRCKVAPAGQWPVSEADSRTFLSKALAQAQFSVHLLGATQARERRSGLTLLSNLELEMSAARQQQDATFKRLIWIPPDLKSTDPAQVELIKTLDNSPTDRDEVVRRPIEEFKNAIQEEIERVSKTNGTSP